MTGTDDGARGRAGAPSRPGPASPKRRPAPSGQQRQMMARISAGRRARRHRSLLVASGALSALVMLVSGSAWALTGYVNAHLGRVNAGTTGTPSSGPLNILVAGLDERTGLTRLQQERLHVGQNTGETNTDTLMVVHVPADHRFVRVVSLPRDSWVNIPGYGMSKINAALGLGGPQLMVQTVEQATGLTINDYVEVNFLGFVKVIDALGGVNICLPYAVHDPYSSLRMSAGVHHVDGITALEFARDRHSFPTSDLARIQDQQQLISSALIRGMNSGLLADPVRLESFLSAASAAIRVDQGFNVVSLADELRGLSSNDVTFTTVPLADTSYTTPTGEEAVQWNSSAAAALFNGLKTDQPPPVQAPATPVRRSATPARPAAQATRPASRRTKPAPPGLRRRQVSLDVYNGTTIAGLSGITGRQLAALGFMVHQSGVDWSSPTVARTVIQYPAGDRASAQLVRQVLPGATIQRVKGLPRIRIVLGASGYTVAGAAPSPSPARSSGPPSPAV